MNVAKSIRVSLAMENKKQTWLANELGVSRAYVSALCTGVKRPSMDKMTVIANVFGISVSEFVKRGE